ncbi:hypothetical protein HYU14_02325 [Candidatus Woesearchaeota archaeon]|nr:hypothetical protein [Candidatus Woesearchaeota archaeon]
MRVYGKSRGSFFWAFGFCTTTFCALASFTTTSCTIASSSAKNSTQKELVNFTNLTTYLSTNNTQYAS